MKLYFNRRYTTIAVYALLVLVGAVLFWRIISQMRYFQAVFAMVGGLLKPFIYAFAIAYILNPVLKFIEQKLLSRMSSSGLKRGISILATFVFAGGLVTIFGFIVLPRLVDSVSTLAIEAFTFINSRDTWMPLLIQLLPNTDINATIIQYLQQSATQIFQTLYSMLMDFLPLLKSFGAGLASGLLNVVVGIIISVYMLMNKEAFGAGAKRMLYAFIPHTKADWLLELAGDSNRIFGGFISGKILDSIIIGIICFAGLKLLNIPNELLVSVIVGVTNVVPYFGPFIGAIPSFFIILIDAPIKSLVFLVFILILQQFDGNILGPKILGDSTGLSAFWVIFSIMLFGGLYGFIGMFLGVPVFSVISMLLGRLVRNNLSKRNMPLDINSYCAPDAPLIGISSGAGPKLRGHAHTVKQVEKQSDEPPDSK